MRTWGGLLLVVTGCGGTTGVDIASREAGADGQSASDGSVTSEGGVVPSDGGVTVEGMCSCTLPAINPADYNQGCVTSEDCAAVWVGDVCSCSCDAAAINKSDEARYAGDVQSRLSHCGPLPSCGACDQVRTTCIAGRCAIIDCGAVCSDAGVGDPDAH